MIYNVMLCDVYINVLPVPGAHRMAPSEFTPRDQRLHRVARRKFEAKLYLLRWQCDGYRIQGNHGSMNMMGISWICLGHIITGFTENGDLITQTHGFLVSLILNGDLPKSKYWNTMRILSNM